MDVFGDHRAACAITGRLRRRAKPIELAWATVFAEAGAVVQDQVLLRDTNLPGIDPTDRRQLDLVAWGLRGFGRPICGDATIVSPLHRDGTPWVGTPDVDGASFERAVALKPDLPQARFNLVTGLLKLERYSDALLHIEALATKNPRDIQVQRYLEFVRAKLREAAEPQR